MKHVWSNILYTKTKWIWVKNIFISYPWRGGEHVFVLDLKAVHLLQDYFAVLFSLEEVSAADNSGDSLGLMSLDQHCGRRIIGFDTPKMGENGSRKKMTEVRGEQEIMYVYMCMYMYAFAFLHIKILLLITSISRLKFIHPLLHPSNQLHVSIYMLLFIFIWCCLIEVIAGQSLQSWSSKRW